ncbi:MAG: fibrobacter succinogenes major paralogous domain-containing protein [Salinivirgaceae bacterium]|nr:fibrobacter succinogenes major paralogous domain-containing protein [Salinivirgaceae bacterium]
MKRYLLSLIAICLFSLTNAQVVTTTCGIDTIILEVENYKSGIIEWEESLDTIVWLTIEDEIGESYKFFPTETKYYRASVITSECDPLYSAITLVQLPPAAYAGSDREFGGNTAKLMGSYETGSVGTWSIIEGENGSITSPNDPYSEFTGEYDEPYQLIWTVTNGCGQSTDTVSIVLEEIKAKDNFIVVDNTDIIAGDSAERASGIYRIKFSDASILPSDTMMLIGMREDISFIVKILSYTKENDFYVISTAVGGIEDIIQSGPVNVGDGVNESMVNDGKSKFSEFPTRKTLKEYAKNKNQVVIYSSDFSDQYGNRMSISRKKSSSKGLKLSIPDQEIFATEDGLLSASIENTYVRFEPNFVCDFKIGFFTINDIKIGLDNGEFEYNYKLSISATAAKELSKEVELLELSNNTVFMVGALPVLVASSFTIKAAATLSASATLTVSEEKNYQKNFTALLKGDKINDIEFVSFSTSKTTTESSYDIEGRLDAEFSIGPEISVELYKVVGPYFELPLTLAAGICVNENLNWYAEASLGIEGNLGIKAHLGSLSLFDMQHTLFKGDLMKPLMMPYKVQIRNGNNQVGMQDELLALPLTIRVTSNYGFGVPLVPVRFSLAEGNGSIAESVRFTDVYGKVSVDDWTLGDNQDASLKISVLNCDDEDVSDFSPILAYAYGNFNCVNTDLSLSLNKTETGIITEAKGGTAPYTYSYNGTDFFDIVPEFLYSSEGSFMVYAKDSNKCNANRMLTVVKPDICKTIPLFIDMFTTVNVMQLTGISGVPPYQFSVDDAVGFSDNNLFSNLTPGMHKAYAKDNNQCMAIDSFEIAVFETKAINASTPRDKAQYYNTENITFSWKTTLFATNQTYDLYLKNGEEAYLNIAQNLSDESFFHAETLDFSSQYSWKVVVKDQDGVEKENAEFSFKTMADPTILATTPILISPANNELTDTTVTLKWQTQGGDFKYDVYLDGNLKFYSLTTDSVVLSNLTRSMTYNWKVKVKSPTTTQSLESEVWNFEAVSILPTVVTNVAYPIGALNATLSGNVISQGLTSASRGFCWGISPETIESNIIEAGTGTGTFRTTISGLETETTYYFKTYATNSNGTVYGNQETFTTLAFVPVMDGDGNTYTTLVIGEQEWIGENLKTTTYEDGTAVPFNWYSNDTNNKDIYGGLYTWDVISPTTNGGRNVCPCNFHLPSYEEWEILVDYVGSPLNAGGRLKEAGTAHWVGANTGATNSSGFTALPGGQAIDHTDFNTYINKGDGGYWYSSTESESDSEAAYYLTLSTYTYSAFIQTAPKSKGFSVRCVKD